jgi:DNA-binding SARP family transcriptional activator
VEEAACLLVDLALAAGLQPLAEWALARSVLVVPHSETLAAAAMEVAAATGSPDSLRRAFDHLRDLVDSLEPGSWPLATHEARYAELRRSVLA